MANHKSAEKRARQEIRRTAVNRNYTSSMRTAIKKFRVAAEGLKTGAGVEEDAVKKLFVGAQAHIAKAASKGILHKNNASRRVSRLSKVLSDSLANIGKGAENPAVKKKKKTTKKKKTSAKKKSK